MQHKYKSKMMRNKLFKSASFLKLVLFLFLVTGINKNTYSQCIVPGDTVLCYGEQITYCVNISPNVVSILWSTGDTTPCITVNPTVSATYTVIVQDTGSCFDTVQVDVNPQINITALTQNIIPQPPACTGSIFSSVSGGSPPYTFDWDTSGVSFLAPIPTSLQNLCENTYCLKVTDQSGCTADSCFNIEWNPCVLTAGVLSPILCNGDSGAFQINVDTTNGQGPFTIFGPVRFEFTIYTANSLIPVGSQLSAIPSWSTLADYPAGDYVISVYDRSWRDSCFTNITLNEPDPIVIHTTVDSASAAWVNDGSILIDSITGGVGNNTWVWYDSSFVQSPPGTSILLDSLLLDSIYFSHEYYGGYSIVVTDSNLCTSDTTLYVYPINTVVNFDTAYVAQDETCFGFDDGKIFGSMNDSAVPPFTYYWVEVATGDTIRVDCFGCPPPSNYNVSHVATNTNLPPGCYDLSAEDAFGNPSFDIPSLCIEAADSMYVVINPDLASLTLACSENILLSAVAYPLPDTAQLMPNRRIMTNTSGDTTFTMNFTNGTVNGATYSLYDSPQRTYFLECDGQLTDNSTPPVNYDAAFMDWPGNPIAQNSIWSWNSSSGGTVPLLNNSAYDGVDHRYTWSFPANSNSANQNGINANFYDHEFFVSTTTMTGILNCKVYAIVDTIIYDYVWTTVANPAVVLSTADTLQTDSSVIVTTDYVVTVNNNNECVASDTITIVKNLNTLASTFDITPVRPCYGDLTGEIHIDVVDSTGVQPFTYLLYDANNNLLQTTTDTFFTGLASGNYFIQVQDTIGCEFPSTLVFIDQPDTIFACGVDLLNDTTFDVFTHTVVANDPSTWNFQTGVLAPNFQYYLEVDSTFGLHSIQQLPTTFDQDAAFENYSPIINPNPGPFWVVDGDVLRPDIDVYNNSHIYIYNSPSDVNGGGPQNDYFTGSGNILNFQFFGLNNPTGDTIHNQGGLRFRLHKIACTQTDTAFTCKGEALGFAHVRPQSVNGNLGGIPFAGPDGVLGTADDYYETAWIKYDPFTGANIDTIQGGPGYGPSDTIVNLFAGSYRVVVIDSLGCSEFVRYLEVVEPIDTFTTVLDTFVHILCKFDSTGIIEVSNFGGFDSIAWNGSVNVPIASTTSRYAVLMKDTTSFNACNDINSLPPANYVDTIITYIGVLDSIIFENLNAGRYRVFVYDSLPDATYGKYNPLTGDLLANPFNYMMCPEIIDVYLMEPCDSLSSTTTLLADVTCWGDSTGQNAGSAFAQAIGGTFPYTYQWHNEPFGVNGVGEFNDTAYSLWADTVLNAFPNYLWHTVTVTDAVGCHREDSIQIKHVNRKIRPFYVNSTSPSVNDTIWDLRFIEDSASCFGVCDGVVSLQSLGGVYPHGYVWDTDPFVTVYNQPDTTDGLCAGGHDVLITDDIGCQERILFRIEEPDELFAIGSVFSPITCYGFDDGNSQAIGIGGNNLSNTQNSYSFNWVIGNDTIAGQNLDSIPPGIHTIIITDYKGCTATDTAEFIEPTELSVVIVDSFTVYAYCENTNSAQLCARAIGGTPNYVYQWNDPLLQNNTFGALPNGPAFCATNLTPVNLNSLDGSYTVSVIDDRGCVADTSIDIDTISNTFNVNSIITSTTHVSCFGGFDGAIDIVEFKIIDSTGINPITLLPDTFYTIINLPNSGYTYTWTGPNGYSQTTEDISSLYAGSYAVIVEDSNGCRRTKNIEVEEPDQLYFGIYNSVDATCVGDGYTNTPTMPPTEGSCDGQIMVNITGGTWPYYYDTLQANVWPIPLNNLSLIGTTQSNDTLIDGLCFGMYNIYITDAKGCEGQVIPGGSGSVYIDSGIVVTVPGVDTDPASCFNIADGVGTLQLPGADPLFNYTWRTDNLGAPSSVVLGTTTPSYNGFAQGTSYWVVAHYSDPANFGLNYTGCDAAQSFTIPGTNPIYPNESFIEPDCWGEATGEITLNPTSSALNPGFAYAWDTTISLPQGSNSISENNLLAGTYGITITDGDGCDTTIAVELTQPDQLQNNFVIDPALCNGDNGIIDANPQGGTMPIVAFNWNPPNILTPVAGPPQYKFEGPAGTYRATIVDGNGCSIVDTAIISEPNPLLIDISSNNDYGVDSNGKLYYISCHGLSDGEVIAIGTGGSQPYEYSDNGVNYVSNNIFSSLSSGIVTFYIKDANGCEASSTVDLLEPNPITDNETIYVSCYGADDAWISLNPSGGVPFNNGAYTYSWPGQSSTDSVLSNLTVNGTATFSVNIEDANGCVEPFSYILTSPPEFTATVSTVNYAGATHPPFDVLFVDSTAYYMNVPVEERWIWTNGATVPGSVINSGDIGEFTFPYPFEETGPNDVYVIVTNQLTGCEQSIHFVIDVQGIPEINNVFTPNGDGVNDVFMFNEFAVNVVSVEIYNRWGQLVNNWTDVNKGWDGTGPDGQELPEGVYFFVLTADGEDGYYYSEEGTITLLR